MSTDKPYVDNPYLIMYPDNQSILVSCYIEDNPVVLQDARASVLSLDRGWACPFRFAGFVVPCSQGLLSIRISCPKVPECFDGNYSHVTI